MRSRPSATIRQRVDAVPGAAHCSRRGSQTRAERGPLDIVIRHRQTATVRSRTNGMWWGTAIEAPDPGALAQVLLRAARLAHRARGAGNGHPRRSRGIHLRRVPAGNGLPGPRLAAGRRQAAPDDALRLPGRRPRIRGRRGGCARSDAGSSTNRRNTYACSSTRSDTRSASAATTANRTRTGSTESRLATPRQRTPPAV